jgi:hypothetical protein
MKALNIRLTILGLLASLFIIGSCNSPTKTATQAGLKESREEIGQLAIKMESDISKNGPVAWLNYFEESPDFFMASNGELVFKDYQGANSFITKVLVKNIAKIALKLTNIHVDPYTAVWGSIGADFNEDLTDPSGKTIGIDGYFTATVHKTANGWKLRNAHWSIKPAG